MTETKLQTHQIKSILESLLFLSDKPLPLRQLKDIIPEASEKEIREAAEEIRQELEADTRGLELAEVANGFQLRTKSRNSPWIFRLNKARPTRLSRAALETLAIVAYRQPVTRPEVDEIRGVDSGPVLRTLLERNIVRILGKREEPGNPLIYGTTGEFLEVFGLKNLSDLPTLREYTELGQDSLRKLEMLLPDQTPNLEEVEGLSIEPTETKSEEPTPSA